MVLAAPYSCIVKTVSMARPAGDASRPAGLIAVAVLCLVLVAKAAFAVSAGAFNQLPFVAALSALPLLSTFPGTRGLITRYRWQSLAVQSALTYAPFAAFGSSWVAGVSGLLAGLVLLTVSARTGWLLAGAAVAAELVIRVGIVGLPWTPGLSASLWVLIASVDDGLMLFGLVRLAELVREAESARNDFVDLALARERLQATEDLQLAVGEHLSAIATDAEAARQTLSRLPGQARAHTVAAGIAARQAAAQVRAVARPRRQTPEPGWEAPPAADTAIVPRLAWAIFIVVLCGLSAQEVNNVYLDHLSAGAAAVQIAGVAAVAILQLYHSRRTPGDGRPRGWQATLATQTLLCYLPFSLVPARYISAPAFAAGSALLLIPGRWRWAAYAGIIASWSALYVVLPQAGMPAGPGVADVVYVVAVAAGIGLMVYGLARMVATARRLQVLRDALARTAVLQERLRVARDVHDLLGLGLSAIALKADGITRLIGYNETLAAAQLAEVCRICAAVRADVRLVTRAGQQLSLAAEVSAARELLISAGIRVQASIGNGPLPEAADVVLAPVLREAVTNILRHSKATTCTIEATANAGGLSLHVSNDGVAELRLGGGAGTGLANLTDRIQAAGGRLTKCAAGGRFDLLAEIPLG